MSPGEPSTRQVRHAPRLEPVRDRGMETALEDLVSKKNLIAASGFAAAVVAAAVAGSVASPARGKTRQWYDSLEKPPFQPPKEVFPIAWTLLYSAMAYSAYRVWKKPERGRERALALWGAQLALNAAWSPLFFAARKPALAMADLVALFGVVVAYTRDAARIDKPSALLMTPYLAWLLFAGVLNEEIVRRN